MIRTNRIERGITMNENIVTRPVWSKHIKGRAVIWYRRECSAYDLAKRITGENVTETEYNAAFDLLNRIQRYALASASQWERANNSERYCNSAQCTEDEKRLDKRREKLVKELGRYNVQLVNYGLYPSIVATEENGYQHDLYALHYFD